MTGNCTPLRARALQVFWSLMLLLPGAALGATAPGPAEVAGRLQMAIGQVERAGAAGAGEALTKGDLLRYGDTVKTGVASYAYLVLVDGSQAFVRPGSQLTLEKPGPKVARGVESGAAAGRRDAGTGLLLRMTRGAFRLISAAFSPGAEPTAYQTSVATIGIRGTEFEVTVAEDQTSTIFVLEGLVDVANLALPDTVQRVGAGQFTVVRLGQAPTPAESFEFDDLESDGFELSASLERIEDPALDSVEAPADARYLALAEPYLDFRRNPAYSVQSPGGLSRLSLAGSASRHATTLSDGSGTGAQSGGESGGWLGQGVGIRRIRPNLWLSAHGAAGRDTVELLQRGPAGQSATDTADSKFELHRNRVGLALARQGERLSVGLAADFEESELEFVDRLDGSRAVSDNTLSGGKIGGLLAWEGGATLGLSYRHAKLRSRGVALPVATRLRGHLNEIDLLYRRPLAGSASLGASLRLEQARSTESAVDSGSGVGTTEPDETTALKAAAGLGWALADGSLVSLDLAMGFSEKQETLSNPAGQPIERGRDEAWNVGLHLGSQVRVHGPLVLTVDVSSLYLRSDERSEQGLNTASAVIRREESSEYRTSASLGFALQRGVWTLGYLANASTRVDRELRHSLYLIASW